MKLTNDQIESIRAVSPELAEKLEAGEKVTVEKAVEKWEPSAKGFCVTGSGEIICDSDLGYVANGACRQEYEQAKRLAHDQRIFNRLHAYRDEFAPGYVVPEVGKNAWHVYQLSTGEYSADFVIGRMPEVVYMPEDVCLDLCRKLNSGEVVL